MSDPVAFIERKLAMVDKMVLEEGSQVQKLFQRKSVEDEPLYCIDDDYYHPLAGDPLTIITLAAATRALLDLHYQTIFYPEAVPACTICGFEATTWPCPTLKELAKGWGWSDDEADR